MKERPIIFSAAGASMKTCRTCNELKPADAYRGTRSACRECENAQRREWHAANAESGKARAALSKENSND